MYKYIEKEVEIGDVIVIYCSKLDLLIDNLTENKPYLVTMVNDSMITVINDNEEETSFIKKENIKIIKNKSLDEAKKGDTCMVVDKSNPVFGSTIEASSVSDYFIYWNEDKYSYFKPMCIVLEKEEPKETLEEYLIKNNIFDKFIFNSKDNTIKTERQSIRKSFTWGDTTDGHYYWYDHFEKAPDYDGSMDWIIDDYEETREEGSFCIMFNSINEIKEAVEYGVLDYDYGYNNGDVNENKFPTIFRKNKLIGLSHQPNSGKRNIWIKPEYKEWVKESITWNKYKDKLEQEQGKCDSYIPPEETDLELDIKNNWVGFLYKEDGSLTESILAKSEKKLNKLFKDKKHVGMTMRKYKYTSTREEKNRKQTIEQKLNDEDNTNKKNSTVLIENDNKSKIGKKISFRTDFETSIEKPWIGIVYYESGCEHLSVRAESEEELDKLFEKSCYKDMTMQKFKLKSIRKEERKFVDISM